MEKSFIFEYLDENNFKKRERSVRKYNMLAYKKLTFEYYPTIRSGKFLGKKISEGEVEFKLRTDGDNEVIKIEEVYDRVKAEFEKNNLKIK